MRLSSHVGGGGWPGGAGGLPPGPLGASSGNYFGDGADGDVVIASSTQLASATDGDMLVKHYKNLTVNAGATLTVANRCRGLLLYVDGDLTVHGSISMTGRGCKANPATAGTDADTPVAASDGNAVPSGGIIIRRRSTLFTNANADTDLFFGCGNAAVSAEAKQCAVRSGLVVAVPRVGGAGGHSASNYNEGSAVAANTGGAAANAPGGGGPGGAAEAHTANHYACGGNATCFSGGPGGGGGNSTPSGGKSSDFGGKGGGGGQSGHNSLGGTGNPGGAGCNGSAAGLSGTGGLVIIIVRGNVTIGAGGVIEAKGVNGPSAPGGHTGGGASGGGAVALLYAGDYSNAGTITAAGGAGTFWSAPAWGGGGASAMGGNGGVGAIIGPHKIER